MNQFSDSTVRGIARWGETITLRRMLTASTWTDISVRARVKGYAPDELVGGITQADRKIIALAVDVTFNPALRQGDKAIIRGRTMNLERVDDSTRRPSGELAAYELLAKG